MKTYFITFKSVAFDDRTLRIEPPISKEEIYRLSTTIPLTENELRDFGLNLFHRFFVGPVLESFKEDDPSPIALVVSDELSNIPWELLHDGSDWVARKREIIRAVITSRGVPDILPRHGHLRVLAGISEPIVDATGSPIPSLGIEAYGELFEKLSKENSPIEVKVRKNLNRQKLSWEMSDNYHVFHFVGRANSGKPILETRYGEYDLANDSWFREVLTTGLRGNLRIVVLDVCHSESDRGQVVPLVTSLVNSGVPVVVSFRDQLSRSACSIFLKTFYNALAGGQTVIKAVNNTRHAMAIDWQLKPQEWSLPMLFINSSLLDAPLNIMDPEMVEMIIEPRVSILSSPKAQSDPSSIPDREIVGRNVEINQILRNVDPERPEGPQVTCLYGEEGIGKTSVCAAIVKRTAEWFDKVIWIPEGEQKEGLEDFLRVLICKLSIISEQEFLLDQSNIEKQVLSLLGKGRTLLVLEQPHPQVTQALLPKLPMNCKVFMTCNEPTSLGEQVKIGYMEHDQLAELVKLSGLTLQEKELEALLHFTGSHTMLVRLLSGYASLSGKDLRSTLNQLKKTKGDVQEQVLSISLKNASREGRMILSALSIFDSSVPRRALGQICRLGNETFNSALDRLTKLSIIESYQQGKRFGLHSLVRKALKDLKEQELDQYLQRAFDYYLEFANATMPMLDVSTAMTAIEAQMPAGTPQEQIRSAAIELIVKPAKNLLESEINNFMTILSRKHAKGDLSSVKRLLEVIALFLVKYGHSDLVLKYYDDILKVEEQPTSKMGTLMTIGSINYNCGNVGKATQCYEEALKIATEQDQQDLKAELLERIGHLYRENNEIDKAMKSFQDLVSLLHGNNDIEKARIMTMLAEIYWQAGRNSEAIETLKEALEILNQIGDKRAKADALNLLGGYYLKLDQYDASKESYTECLSAYKELDDKRGQGLSLAGLAKVYMYEGNLDKALECCRDSLGLLGQDSDKSSRRKVLDDLALIYSMQKKWARSADACRESFLISTSLGANDVLESIMNTLSVSKKMFDSGEYATPAQLAYDISQLIGEANVASEEMRAALAICHGILTMISFMAASECNKSNNIYKEAVELAHALDTSTGNLFKLSEFVK